MSNSFGQAKYGSKIQYFKIKDGSQTFRVVPPMGDLADDGVWSRYYRINYGYVNAENKSRPFESSLVKNNKSKMIEVPDAAVERFEMLKAKYEDAHKRGDVKTKEALVPLVGGPKSRYNVDSNHYVKAYDLQGNLGILKLRHKCKQQLDIAIKELREKNIDPLHPDSGRFFVFTRTGTRNETAFNVKVLKQTMNVEGVGEVERDVVAKIDEGMGKRIYSELKLSLDKLFKKPSASQIAQIVAESNLVTGVSPNIDKILDMAKEESTGDAEVIDESDDQDIAESTAASASQALASLATAPAQQAVPAPTPAATPAPVQAQTAPAETPTATAVETPTQPTTTAEKVADMSDADFLASMGIS